MIASRIFRHLSLNFSNSYRLASSASHVVDKKEYEYIIVGAGSAGCALARRLSDEGKSVALIEAGRNYNSNLIQKFKIRVPLCLGMNMHDEKANFCYHTTKQKHMNNRVLYCPRGKIVGGSSAINGMVFIRGHKRDFDRWSEEGATGWNYKNCLPYFKMYENCQFDVDPQYRGTSGLLNITRASTNDLNPLSHSFFEACKEYGIPSTTDFNGAKQEGYALYDRTIYHGMRNDAYSAFINKSATKSFIDLFTDSFTVNINIEKSVAKGVTLVHNKNSNKIKLVASKEVILSAGAINSPKLLLLSGIGDENDLKKVGIKTVHHLPGVGKNLQDHLEFYIQHSTKSSKTLHSLAKNYIIQAKEGLQWLCNGTGKLGASHLDAGAFTFTDRSMKHCDVQIHFFPYGVLEHGLELPKEPCFQIHVGTLRAHSKGSVKLSSKDPFSEPIIDFNYLADERDVDDLVKCVQIGRDIFSKKPLRELSTKELSPGRNCKTKEDMNKFVRANAESAYHPSCTCKMGSDKDKNAVLDPQLRVKGIQNLRVVDASSFPSIVSGNLNSAVIMLAYKAADLILDKTQ